MGLTMLDLRGNLIKDISPLAGLTGLGYLSLDNNPICSSDKEKLKQALPDCVIT